MADEDVATSAAAKGASAEEEGSAAVLEPAVEQEPAAVPETAAAPTQEAILSFVADLISRTPIENLTVKEIVGELKNGPLHAESGRDYSKPWLREEIDRLVSEAETAQEQAASQGDWAPGTVVWARMSAYPFWPARVKRPPPAAAADIAEKGGALVKFYGTHDHLHCAEVETWAVGVERGWREKPSIGASAKVKKEYFAAVSEAEAELDSPSQLSDAPGAESDSGEEEGQEEEEEEEEEFGEAGGEEAAGEEAEEEDGGIIIARKGGRPSGGGRKRTGKSLAAAERAAAGEPKRAQNGYMFWSQTARAQLMSENPSLAITEVSKLMGQKWREMSEEDKAPWQAKAAEDKVRFDTELAAFNAEHGDTVAQKKAKERAAGRGGGEPRKRAAAGGGGSKKAREEADALDLVTAKLEHHVAIGDDLERQLSKASKTLAKLPQKRAAAEAASDAGLVDQCDAYSRELTAERDRLQGQLKVTSGKIAKYTGRYEALTNKKRPPAAAKADKPKPDETSKADKAGQSGKQEAKAEAKSGAAKPAKPAAGATAQGDGTAEAGPNGRAVEGEAGAGGPPVKRLKKGEPAGPPSGIPAATRAEVEALVGALQSASAAGDDAGVAATLGSLDGLRMSVELLTVTGAGKAVNKVRKAHPAVEAAARALVEKWKAQAAAE